MWLMLQQLQNDDFVLAAGQLYSVCDLCEMAFGYLRLDYRDYVRENAVAFCPNEPV